eukprot:371226-Rhodomonas_salina.1
MTKPRVGVPQKPQGKIPKKMYMFWDGGWLRESRVRLLDSKEQFENRFLAENTCRDMNPTWELVLLNSTTADALVERKRYIPDHDWKNITVQARSDILRTMILHLYGGVWVDSSVFCNMPLDDWLELDSDDLVSFRRDDNKVEQIRSGIQPWITSWFLAAGKGSYTISKVWNVVTDPHEFRRFKSEYFWWHRIVAQAAQKDHNIQKRIVNVFKSADPMHCFTKPQEWKDAPVFKRCQMAAMAQAYATSSQCCRGPQPAPDLDDDLRETCANFKCRNYAANFDYARRPIPLGLGKTQKAVSPDVTGRQGNASFSLGWDGGNGRCWNSGSIADELNCLTRRSIQNGIAHRKIAFLKSHKTGSTTLATILHRFGSRHCLDMYAGRGDHYWHGRKEGSQNVDIYNRHSTFSVFELHRKLGVLIGQPFFFFSIFRDPVENYVSRFNYFMATKEHVDLNEHVFSPEPFGRDSLLREDLKVQLQDVPKALALFDLILLTEHFDEGMVILAERLGWHAIDASYVAGGMNVGGGKDYAGRSIGNFKLPNLPNKTVSRIRELVALDLLVYSNITKIYEQHRANFTARLGAEELERRVEELRRLNRMLAQQCTVHPHSASCFWYSLNDMSTEDDAAHSLIISRKQES